jgi:hypothetical protein
MVGTVLYINIITFLKFVNSFRSFCIGLKGSPDLEAAQKVATFLGRYLFFMIKYLLYFRYFILF